MVRLVYERSGLQVFGDLALAGARGATNGFFGRYILTTAGYGGYAAAGSLATIAGACALGGALLIIPAIMLHKMLFDEPNSFLLDLTTNIAFRSAFAFGSACLGAAILGLAIIPVGVTALSSSLAFGILNMMTKMIVELTETADDAYDQSRVLQIG